MSEQLQKTTPDTLWVLVMNDGKWIPDSKFSWDKVTSALKRGEELDCSPDYDAVKVVKIANGRAGDQKEVWASSRLAARAEARRANELSAAVAKSAQKFSPRKNLPAGR